MKKTVIFSGTTEGRLLSGMLAKEGFAHTVCVATDYGRDVMGEALPVNIHVGRMDEAEITGFFKELNMGEEDIVIDATHPYALEVTENIKKAADALKVRYERIVRKDDACIPESSSLFSDITECAEAVEKSEGNILLTTGSKELKEYCEAVSEITKKRTFVRVLPTEESLGLCREEKIDPDHIIAMQGPFGRGLNEALMRQLDIKNLITKESGEAGGFKEKLEAAENCGVKVYVIKRPVKETGIDIKEAFRLVTGKETDDIKTSKKLYLIGAGMGDPGLLGLNAKEALKTCEAVFGAKRLLKSVSCLKKYELYKAEDILAVLKKEEIQRAAVLFSGDTGFFSGAKQLIEAAENEKDHFDTEVIPGISSFSFLASRLKESYDDACLFSIHGKNSDRDLALLIDKIRYNKKVFLLLSDLKDVPKIAEKLEKSGIEAGLIIGKDLSGKDERIIKLSVKEALDYTDEGIAAVFIKNDDPKRRPLLNVKKDGFFIRDNVPMTKECIRHESLIRLDLKEGDLFYDIGGGTGSVAVEAAALSPRLTVVTVEKEREACELIRKNIDKAGLFNVSVIEGRAEEVLISMQKPDCVFIGGTGGSLRRIIEILHSKGDGIRFVINAVSIETMEEVRKVIRDFDITGDEAVMISVSDIVKTGEHHMLKAQNPVCIFSFTF